MKISLYSLVLSLVLVIILMVQQNHDTWPGVFFLLLQAVLLGGVLVLLRWSMRRQGKPQLLPVIRLFRYFFAVIFPVWILLAVTGRLASALGRLYAMIVVILFIALVIVLLMRILSSTDLLDRFQ